MTRGPHLSLHTHLQNKLYPMRIKQGIELRNVCGENVLIAQGIQNLDMSHLIVLNESAALVFNAVRTMDAFTDDDVVNILTAEYDVTPEAARADATRLMDEWLSQKVAE